MKHFVAILFILNIFCVNAQNWDLMSLDRSYYFGTQEDSLKPVYTDYVITFSTDTVAFHLNTFFSYCDTCTVLDPNEYFIRKQHGFLNKLIFKQGTDFLILNPDSLIIKTAEPLNSTWLFDPANGITAYISELSEENILGNLDSVKTILLSNNDTIKISKNYGIIKYQAQGVNYDLGGAKINGTYFGLRPQGYKRFYDFEVGDVFQYREIDNTKTLSSSIEFRTRKVKINFKHVTSDTITYSIIEKVFSNGYAEPNYWSENYQTTYFYDANNLAEKKSLDVLDLGLFCNNFEKFLVTGIQDTLMYGYERLINYNSDFYKRDSTIGGPYKYLKIAEGLGVVNEHFSCNEKTYGKYLTGYIKNGVQTGEVWEDSRFTSIKDLNKESNISVFPNPSSDIVFVHFETPEQNLNIHILDRLGKRVLKQSFSGQKQITLDVSSFSKGIYFLKLETKNAVYQQRILVY